MVSDALMELDALARVIGAGRRCQHYPGGKRVFKGRTWHAGAARGWRRYLMQALFPPSAARKRRMHTPYTVNKTGQRTCMCRRSSQVTTRVDWVRLQAQSQFGRNRANITGSCIVARSATAGQH
jgi:hypothetical protein